MLADTNDQREITLIYCNKTIADIAYKEIFDEAKQKNNLKMIYILTNEKEIDNDTYICKNAINSAIIKAEIPDYSERIFYISGPHSMVNNFEKILIELGINKNKIKTDFFPGFV
ncbi:MAG: hypothetical protein NT091_00640 [Candidatus Falkowbacteria bacterium]|nr:hypothetical protein [Candidatus Falkowbacteria bacterium]